MPYKGLLRKYKEIQGSTPGIQGNTTEILRSY